MFLNKFGCIGLSIELKYYVTQFIERTFAIARFFPFFILSFVVVDNFRHPAFGEILVPLEAFLVYDLVLVVRTL